MTEAQQHVGARPFRLIMRIPVPWVFVLAYLVGVSVEYAWPLHVGAEVAASVTLALGAVVFTIGAVVAGWGLVTFRRARTTTVPGKISARLVTWGPYRFSRNPMYVGLAVAYVGEALLLRQVWPVVLLTFVLAYVNWTVIPVEQAKLTEVFGQEYAGYQQRVRRWL